jgi:hypothetical protein
MLVDEGLIDCVIFTELSDGAPLNESDLKPFSKSKANYVGGTYGYQCVGNAIEEIRKYAPYRSIRPIKDAILFNEPDFFDKLMVMNSGGTAWMSGTNSGTSFYIREKIYSLFNGVRSEKLLI